MPRAVATAVTLVVAILLVAAPQSSSGADTRQKAEARVLFSAAYVRCCDPPGDRQIYSIESSGQGAAQLTFGATPSAGPVPSPDSSHIVFSRGRGGPDSLWIMKPNGTAQKRLVRRGFEASWSSDSKRIAYVALGPKDENEGVRVIGTDGHGDTLIARAPASHPAWAPSGDSLAFVRRSSLIVLQANRARTIARGAVCCVSWSPDGHQLAYEIDGRIEIVRADGSHRRLLGLGSAPAWSPNGRLIAYIDEPSQIAVRELGTGVTRILGPPRPGLYPSPELSYSWAADSRAIVYSNSEDRDWIWLLRLKGGPRIITSSFPDVGGVSWSMPPSGLSYRQPEPPGPIASGNELKSRAAIDELAADGDRVAFRMCSTSVATWSPRSSSVIPVYNNFAPFCVYRQATPFSVAIAGDRVAWVVQTGYGYVDTHVVVRSLSTGEDAAVAESGPSSGPERISVGFVLGGGDLLTFSSRKLCEDFPPVPTGPTCATLDPSQRSVLAQTIWRVRDPSWQGSCPYTNNPHSPALRAGPCQELATEPGPFIPSDLDRGRIAAVGDRAVVVLDGEGSRLFDVQTKALAAFISGSSLVVLVQGSLHVYDMGAGVETAAWPLPDVTSSGVCRDWDNCSVVAKLHVEDVADGLVSYVFDGKVHVMRLSDGSDMVVADGTHAVFGGSGLFFSYLAPYPWHGRIRFVPFANLPRR